jgi:ribosome-associated protein
VTLDSLRPEIRLAVEAVQNKKAAGVTLLDLAALSAFTDYFLICSGFSSRQVQAISDEVEETLGRRSIFFRHREGYDLGEWVLLDYGDFVVHVFNERARQYYDLERLWRAARRTDFPDTDSGAAQP